MLDSWISRMASAKVLMGDADALRAELSAWLDLIERMRGGESWAEAELMRLVSFHARNLGAEGHAASAALMQIVLLEESLEEAGQSIRPLAIALMRLVVDAHGAGAAQRLAAKHRTELVRAAPVIRIGERAVIGFLGGPLHPEILDALFGRVLRECTRMGAHVAVIDTLGTNPEAELFYRTIEGLQRMPPGDRLRLIITGLADPDAIQKQLSRLEIDMSRIVLRGDVSEVIAELS
jgi:hypothetical protein